MPENNSKLIHTFAALADLGQEVAGTQSFNDLIRTSLHLLLGSLAIRRGYVAKFNRYDKELNSLAMRGLGEDFPLTFPLEKHAERELLDIGLKAIDVNSSHSIRFVNQNFATFAYSSVETLVPLVVREELVGVILLGNKLTGESFTTEDTEIICALSRHIGVGIQQRNMRAELERRAIENEQLYESLKLTYKATVEAFAAAIDSKDKYTQGHSQRVGRYSEIIVEELGWSAEKIEGAAVAGYLHDVGKLVVDRNIINSPMRITASENEQLVRHTTAGYEILLPIKHPFADVPLAAKYHHERLDGRGYPDNLRDREIPYIAKIVCVADSFDAMTTDRPYQCRRPSNEIIEDLQACAGKQFAPELVTAFCRAWLKELTDDKSSRRISKILG
ncbi:MAG: HD domain-containing protein, partial [Pyrinomonadaceae bacterium]|nr:HD domain-containing protein [Pyrinomonadaceae bacterium]